MYSKYDHRFKMQMIVLLPGEYFTTDDSIVIATVLGSCISVCIRDEKANISGMNHFMLPGDFRRETFLQSKSARYGVHAMELLINEMIKKGAEKRNFVAKIFGGGRVLNFRRSDGDIPASNIDFIQTFLEIEDIKIAKQDIGGNRGRKILFFTDSGTVLLKKLSPNRNSTIIREEERYKISLLKKREEEKTDVTLF